MQKASTKEEYHFWAVHQDTHDYQLPTLGCFIIIET